MQFGSGFRARNILQSERYLALHWREGYGASRQHDHKVVDFDGNMTPPGPPTAVPLLSSAPAPFRVPMRQRRPSAPYRLAKLIVESFTALLFGENRWPTLLFPGDEAAQDYAAALVKAEALPMKLLMARGWGGSCGTVGLSWCFHNGRPRVEVHRAKHLFVHEWEDRADLVPAAVSEVYIYPNPEVDAERGTIVTAWYWFHRYWDQKQDIVFAPCPFKKNVEPVWVPEKVNVHDDGEAHVVWVQNLPSDEIDGEPDYEGLYENFDDLDVLCSVLTRGTVLNLDPTLVIAADKASMTLAREVKKGSDNSLDVGMGGSAEYLELTGSSVEAGLKLFESKKRAALEVAQCILADPNEVAASGLSSVALKVIYAPMMAKTNVLRAQYGEAIKRLVTQQMRVARKRAAEQVVILPPKVVPNESDEAAPPTFVERNPGVSENADLHWPPYFSPTPTDQGAVATTMAAATGGKPFLSSQTATEETAKVFGRDPAEEWRRVKAAHQSEMEMASKAFEDANIGGKVEVEKELSGGGKMTFSGADDAGSSKPLQPPGTGFLGHPGASGGVIPGKPGMSGGGGGASAL